MWAANAATVRPSADGGDGKVMFVPANLVSERHRSIEAETTKTVLRAIFRDPERFLVHDPLPATTEMRDEGAGQPYPALHRLRRAGRAPVRVE